MHPNHTAILHIISTHLTTPFHPKLIATHMAPAHIIKVAEVVTLFLILLMQYIIISEYSVE